MQSAIYRIALSRLAAVAALLVAVLAACSPNVATPTPLSRTPTAPSPVGGTPTRVPTPTITSTPTRVPTVAPTTAPTGVRTLVPTQTPSAGPTGTLAGTIVIGPLCPVEPCPSPANPYIGRSLVLEPVNGGDPIIVKLQDDGTFRAAVPAGDYDVQLLNCGYMGCARALPKRVTVKPDVPTRLEINIDTGIR